MRNLFQDQKSVFRKEHILLHFFQKNTMIAYDLHPGCQRLNFSFLRSERLKRQGEKAGHGGLESHFHDL